MAKQDIRTNLKRFAKFYSLPDAKYLAKRKVYPRGGFPALRHGKPYQ